MKPEIKKLWVEALKSGEYEQGFDRLKGQGKNGPCYCVLGVLVQLAENEGVDLPERRWEYISLPLEVQQWAGLTDNNPDVSDETYEIYGEGALMGLNDREHIPFPELANIIEGDL